MKSKTALIIVLALLYIAWAELRLANNGRQTAAVFDESSCCATGLDRDHVRDCFTSRGYKMFRTTKSEEDYEVPKVIDTLSTRTYQVIVTYDKNDRIVKHYIYSVAAP